MARVAKHVKTKSVPALIVFAKNIHQCMVDHAAVFTQPPVAMADFDAAINSLSEEEQKMAGAGKFQTEKRNAARVVVENMIGLLADYVNVKSDGNPVIINDAGFEIVKRGPRRYDTLDMPLNLEVFAIGNGAVKMRWRRVAHAKSYAIEYCKDVITEDAWHNGTYNSAASATVVGLLPLHKYFFRVRAMGSESMKSVYSDVALTVVV